MFRTNYSQEVSRLRCFRITKNFTGGFGGGGFGGGFGGGGFGGGGASGGW